MRIQELHNLQEPKASLLNYPTKKQTSIEKSWKIILAMAVIAKINRVLISRRVWRLLLFFVIYDSRCSISLSNKEGGGDSEFGRGRRKAMGIVWDLVFVFYTHTYIYIHICMHHTWYLCGYSLFIIYFYFVLKILSAHILVHAVKK